MTSTPPCFWIVLALCVLMHEACVFVKDMCLLTNIHLSQNEVYMLQDSFLSPITDVAYPAQPQPVIPGVWPDFVLQTARWRHQHQQHRLPRQAWVMSKLQHLLYVTVRVVSMLPIKTGKIWMFDNFGSGWRQVRLDIFAVMQNLL